MTSTGKRPIIITHYINPTLFWFKYQSADCLPLRSHEEKLQSYATTSLQRRLKNHGHQPVRDEIVLVKHLTMQKWVRCKVEEISECSGVLEFTVWLIDYGYVVCAPKQKESCVYIYISSQPLRTQTKWILPLKTDLAVFEIPLIYKAGLANIVPATTVCGFQIV